MAIFGESVPTSAVRGFFYANLSIRADLRVSVKEIGYRCSPLENISYIEISSSNASPVCASFGVTEPDYIKIISTFPHDRKSTLIRTCIGHTVQRFIDDLH
jgi:hypothetical protein